MSNGGNSQSSVGRRLVSMEAIFGSLILVLLFIISYNITQVHGSNQEIAKTNEKVNKSNLALAETNKAVAVALANIKHIDSRVERLEDKEYEEYKRLKRRDGGD